MAEGARLESVFTGNRNVGSNPTPSASPLQNLVSRLSSPSFNCAGLVPLGVLISVPLRPSSRPRAFSYRAFSLWLCTSAKKYGFLRPIFPGAF